MKLRADGRPCVPNAPLRLFNKKPTMWDAPEHISYILNKVLMDLHNKYIQNQPDDFANPAS